ncbi:MAG: uroporphyrin-III C-methyltransferase/precorrin-2 dehydrogenase/sirohydrochlorin ferrochelatase [Candidatus Azotimanducaceae bacterium]|jgi:uroporphyrin-III C-methyltransferase/precorrin-2 dehydrogenase/sirohydrochlorin ferrochelatase
MDYLPLYFDLRQRRCLVVGGGEIAYRKIDLLLRAKANITLVAPRIIDKLRAALSDERHHIVEREIESQDFDGISLVISATDIKSVNRWVAEQAKSRTIPVNVVDDLELTDVVFPAIIDRSPIIAAVSTGGASPVLTRKIRTLLESLIPQTFSNLAQFLGQERPELKKKYPNPDIRRRVTEKFLDSAGASHAEKREFEDAKRFLDSTTASQTGEVYVVGAGPGDPDLLTLKALQLLQKADIVLYDNLVPLAVLDRARRDAEKTYVGKQGGGKSTAQESINEKLVRLAQEGHRVCRLKGGDPFIFGRGGEEIESLIDAGIPFEVVPGISAANGCAAYAGIPLTHRDYSQSVRFVTGHPKNGQVDLEWREFAHQNQTIVFYMGLGGLKFICEKLIEHGRGTETPIAVIAKGTLPEQVVVTGTLSTILDLVEEGRLSRPTLIIVGEVVAFRDRWNKRRPIA